MSGQRIIWLASYPKSGNTWVRAFLANYFLGGRKGLSINELRKFTLSDIRIDFYQRATGGRYENVSFDDYVKVRQRALNLIVNERDGHHFVKTHHRIDKIGGLPLIPPQITAAAIYLIRNPFDVAPSYARHSGISLDAAIDAMCDPTMVARSPAGVYEVLGRWDDHIASWTGAPGLPHIVMRYEDLKADAKAAFLNLFAFLKIAPDPVQMRHALKATRFEALKQQEQSEGFVERPAHMEAFFHGGEAGGWRGSLAPEQIERLYTAFEPTIARWFPETVADVQNIAGKAGA